MIIERTSNQIVIRVSQKIDSFGFQRIMDYLDYLRHFKLHLSEIDELINKG